MDVLIAEMIFCDTKKSWDWEFTLPSYSADIAAAWLVKEKMCGYMLDDSGIYFRFVENLGARANDIIFHINPLAICRAALLAVMDGES